MRLSVAVQRIKRSNSVALRFDARAALKPPESAIATARQRDDWKRHSASDSQVHDGLTPHRLLPLLYAVGNDVQAVQQLAPRL